MEGVYVAPHPDVLVPHTLVPGEALPTRLMPGSYVHFPWVVGGSSTDEGLVLFALELRDRGQSDSADLALREINGQIHVTTIRAVQFLAPPSRPTEPAPEG